MTIIQTVLASMTSGAGTPPPPPPYNGSFWKFTSDDPNHGFAGFNLWWQSSTTSGGAYSYSTVSAPAPAWSNYTYPDNSSGHTLNFTGNEYFYSPDLTLVSGTWPDSSITIQMWFYPTANDVQIMSETSDQNPALPGYHYSVFEIDSSGYLHGRLWDGTPLVSAETVNLNAWNHVHMFHDVQNGFQMELNSGMVNGSSQYQGSTPKYFGIGLSDVTHMVTTNRFQGKIGLIEIYDTVVANNFNSQKARYGL